MKTLTAEELQEKALRAELEHRYYVKCSNCGKIIPRKPAKKQGLETIKKPYKKKTIYRVKEDSLGNQKITTRIRTTTVKHSCSKECHTVTAL